MKKLIIPLMFFFLLSCNNISDNKIITDSIKEEECIELEGFDSMYTLAQAIAKVESNNKLDAINGNCVGWLQITPICVAEANRLFGVDVYTLDDRLTEEGSYAIFSIIMSYKNPYLDIDKACDVWNPGCGQKYHDAVKAAYKQITTIN